MPRTPTKRGAHGASRPLSIHHKIVVKFAGPPDHESRLRAELAERIERLLYHACARFAATTQPQIWAARIAAGVPYTVHRRDILQIVKLDVDYQNDRKSGAHGRWKAWVRVKNDVDELAGSAGAFASEMRERDDDD